MYQNTEANGRVGEFQQTGTLKHKFNLIPQEKNNYCVCSVLQAIFKKYNIKISQNIIAKSLTKSEYGFRTNDNKIEDFLNNSGFRYEFYWYDETPFNEPDILLYEMEKENGIIGIDKHVYLLDSFNDSYLRVIDPSDGFYKDDKIGNVLKVMNEKGGFFGLIRKLK